MPLSLFPKSLQDKSNLAIEACIVKAFEVDLKPLMLYIIDRVPEKLLYILAKQFHVLGDEGWNLTQNDKERRELVKSAIQLHKYKGTVKALKKVFETLQVSGEIAEWQSYKGRPHSFRVLVNLFNRNLDTATELRLLNLINEYKNERSYLEYLDIYINTRCSRKNVCSLIVEETIII